jgi:alpha-glucosidase
MRKIHKSDRDPSQSAGSKAPSPLRSAGALQISLTRRDFISTALAAPVLLGAFRIAEAAGEAITFKSPNSELEFVLFTTGPELRYRINRAGRSIVELSRLAFLVDGVDLCRDSIISKIERYRIFEKYSTRGVHSLAVNSCLGARISIRHAPSKTDYVLEVRSFNDGIGFRFTLTGEGRRIPDEASTFKFPAGSTVWFHDFEGHYEGTHRKKDIAAVKEGEWAAPPLTAKLPNRAAYVAITESASVNYAGMVCAAMDREDSR